MPKRLRDELAFTPGLALELEAVDGRLEVAVPSRVRVDHGPYGKRFVADAVDPLTTADVRRLMERGRR